MNAAVLEAEGWTSVPTNEFTTLIGPFWTRVTNEGREVGFIAADKHKNHIGTVHGGMLTSFVDTFLGYAVVDSLGGAMHCATVQLQVQFVATAKIGSFISCRRAEVVRRTSDLVFLRGLIHADDAVVASADGVWKILKPRTS